MLTKIEYKGWPTCYRLSNSLIELILTGDVGPRIVHFGLIGKQNLFHENEGDTGKRGGTQWRHYNGHRLWHGPEMKPRTYAPDNDPIEVIADQACIHLIQPVEPTTGIQKEIDLQIDPHQAHVKVTHRLRNTTVWTIPEISIWALSDLTHGGISILPLALHHEFDPIAFNPPNRLVIWDYTDMSDPRWTWGKQFILLRDDEHTAGHQKVGMVVPDGWVAYAVHNQLFVKKFAYIPGANYPDGCSAVLFTNPGQGQLETKSPTVCLEPQGTLEHVEDWYLFDQISMPENDADVLSFVMPKIISLPH
jgi:hypothetical protein